MPNVPPLVRERLSSSLPELELVEQAMGFVGLAAAVQRFDALREHFDDEEIVSLMAVISLFGFLNRWNHTLATELETEPRRFAELPLAARGWRVGKHAGEATAR